MAEYISRDIVLEIINTVNDTGGFAGYADYSVLFDEIDTMPATDVQPVDRWISVDDKLPENIKTVLVWYTCYTLFGLSEGYGLSWYSPVTGWYQGDLTGDNIVVLYWMPLPEPPKDGDTND